MKSETKEWLCKPQLRERLNTLQDELDRILSAKKDITKLAEFDLDALVHLLSPEHAGLLRLKVDLQEHPDAPLVVD